MPRINNPNLTLTPSGAGVTVNVTYTATFNRFERNLAGLGLVYRDRVTVFGVDPPGSTTGADIFILGQAIIPVTGGNVDQNLPRSFTQIVPRSLLNEDPGIFLPDNDEIRSRIRITAETIPVNAVEAFTDQEILTEIGPVVNT